MSDEDLEGLKFEEHLRGQFDSEELVGEYSEPCFNLVNMFKTPELFVAEDEVQKGSALPMLLCQHRKVVQGS